MRWWHAKPCECPLCGWQGMLTDPVCPECGETTVRRSWWDTWGLTILILGVVVIAVLFVAFRGGREFWWG